MYDDRVEIENTGRLPIGITPENIKSSHASFPYNPLIAGVLFKSSFLENWGSGVGRMVDSCREQGMPEPEYEVMAGFVKIVFHRTMGKSDGDVNNLTGSLKEVYLIVYNNPGIKIKQVAEARERSESTVWKQLRILKKMDLIEYRDSYKTGGYYVKEVTLGEGE